MPDLVTTSVFVLEIDGCEIGSFKKCSGIESEAEIIEYKEINKEGRMVIRKTPGSLKWSDITLERRIDNSTELWKWHKQVKDGDIDGARRHGSIVAKDSQMKEVARWNFTNGWVNKWTGADFDASANDVATEKVVITHEGLEKA